jgi:hypothetical protein
MIQVDCPECERGDIEVEKIDGTMMYVCTRTECDYKVDTTSVGREFGMM